MINMSPTAIEMIQQLEDIRKRFKEELERLADSNDILKKN